jgi:hypothetical protein
LPAVAPLFHIVVACNMLFNSVRKEVTVLFFLSYTKQFSVDIYFSQLIRKFQF